jgi:hypothetical protein
MFDDQATPTYTLIAFFVPPLSDSLLLLFQFSFLDNVNTNCVASLSLFLPSGVGPSRADSSERITLDSTISGSMSVDQANFDVSNVINTLLRLEYRVRQTASTTSCDLPTFSSITSADTSAKPLYLLILKFPREREKLFGSI